MVPKSWKTAHVSDICRLQNGHGFTPEVWDTHGLPIIRIQNLNGGTQYNYFSGTPEDDWLVHPGQMLFAWAGTKGVSFGPTIWRGETGVLNQHIFKVFPLDQVDQLWLFYSLQLVTQRIETKAHGFKATLVHVKKSEIDNQVVSLPPFSEQRQIGEILSTWDRSIETVNELILNSEKQIRALMQRLLSSTHQSFRRLHLGDIAVVNQYSLDSSTPPDYSFRYISLSDVNEGRVSTKLETHSFGSAPSRAQRKVHAGDILMSTVRPNLLGFARVTEADAGCIASTGFAVLSPRPGFDRDYLYHYLFSAHVTGQINALVVGSSYPAINANDVEGLIIYCPTLDQQVQIARILNHSERALTVLRREREKLNVEKTALMQLLLTGKRRIKIEDTAVPVVVNG